MRRCLIFSFLYSYVELETVVGRTGSGLQSRSDEREIDVPKQPAKAKKDDAPLDRAVGGGDEVGKWPYLVRIPYEAEQFLLGA